jgi:hypothetical protein
MISAGCAALAVIALLVWTSGRERGEPVEAPAAQGEARDDAAADADRDREEVPIDADAPESEPEDAAPQASPPTPESDWLLRRTHGPDEWEIGTLGAKYVFPSTEFVAYTDVHGLYASAIGPPGARDFDAADPPPATLSAEIEASLDALVGRAIDLLTKKQ